MAALPKKYIKAAGGINKKAWAMFRASKKKTASPSRKKASRRKVKAAASPVKKTISRSTPAAPRKRRRSPGIIRKIGSIARRSVSRRRAPAMSGGNHPATVMQLAIDMTTGIGGAVISSMAVNMLPVNSNLAKALTQTGIGTAGILFLPKTKKMNLVRKAAFGAAMAGGISTVRALMPSIPMLAGGMTPEKFMVPNYSGAMPEPNTIQPGTGLVETTYSNMGENMRFGEIVRFAGDYDPYR